MVFMQDNAPVHTSHVIQNWLGDFSRENQIELLDWPAYSPDLNPIENTWKFLNDAINDKFPDLKVLPRSHNALDRLIHAAIVCWNELEDRLFEPVIKSMPRRMEAVIEAGGSIPNINVYYSMASFFLLYFLCINYNICIVVRVIRGQWVLMVTPGHPPNLIWCCHAKTYTL